jgi:hypothetical protein
VNKGKSEINFTHLKKRAVKVFYGRKTVKNLCENKGNYLIAVQRLADKNKRIPHEEIKRLFELKD